MILTLVGGLSALAGIIVGFVLGFLRGKILKGEGK